ncbi:MAG: ABC transporter substrate-binding protein, partial [Clostridiales bacterium]|nr:ABC transporter substrate-binding protein [Clostridiales bacterium]
MKAFWRTLLSATLIVFLLAGCASSQAPSATQPPQSTEQAQAAQPQPQPEAPALEHATVEWFILGTPPADFDAVLAELNKLANADLNADINVTWVGFGDFLTKYPLILASGENVDLCYSASWMNFATEAAKGAFYPIEDLAPLYAPTAYGWLPEEGIKNLSVNGHLYGLTGDDIHQELMGYILRGDLMKKYGIDNIGSYKDLENFLQAVVDNDPEYIPLGQAADGGLFILMPQNLGLYSVAIYNFPLVVNINAEKEGEIVNLYEFPGALEYFEMMRDWCDRGFWGKNVLSLKPAKSMLMTGEAAALTHSQYTWVDDYIENPAFDLQYFPGQPAAYRDSYTQNVAAIGAGSENPERSLMLYEKIVTDERYFNLVHYGIEGRNYKLTPDGQVEAIDISLYTPGELTFAWMTHTKAFEKDLVGSPPNKAEVWAKVDSMATTNRYKMFTFNSEPVKNEFAAISNIVEEYAKPLAVGLVADPAAGLKTLNDQLYSAGLE